MIAEETNRRPEEENAVSIEKKGGTFLQQRSEVFYIVKGSIHNDDSMNSYNTN